MGKFKELTVIQPVSTSKRCSDYDEDCYKVQSHVHCYLGCASRRSDGTIIELPVADGYCPFIHKPN